MSKSVSQALEYEKTPVSKKVRPELAVKEIEKIIDNFGFTRICWYLVKRYKFQISVLINVWFLGEPLFKFVHQFFT